MYTSSEKSAMMFASLVAMFSSQAMMAMGKLANPMNGKIDRDLNGAQYMIDLLEMLQERTKGNVSDYEGKLLETTLRDLRLNFVVEKNKDLNPSSPAADLAETPVTEDGVPENQA